MLIDFWWHLFCLNSYPGKPCPGGWTRFKDNCYLVHSSINTWSRAQAYCRTLSGGLVKINSPEENEFVLKLVRQKAKSLKQVWIGLKWISTAFYWYDHSVPIYTNWAPGEPNSRGGEPCAHMYTAQRIVPGRASGYWNDVSCYILAGWPNGIVCKRLP